MDVVQLILWIVLGSFFTWGIFLAFVGFRSVPAYSRRRIARTAAILTFLVGCAWVMLWVSAVVFNVMQLIGVFPT